MQERLKELPKKFLEYWNKWTSKQKTIIVSVVAVVIVMIAVFVGRRILPNSNGDPSGSRNHIVGMKTRCSCH